jgi:hypothetical protein
MCSTHFSAFPIQRQYTSGILFEIPLPQLGDASSSTGAQTAPVPGESRPRTSASRSRLALGGPLSPVPGWRRGQLPRSESRPPAPSPRAELDSLDSTTVANNWDIAAPAYQLPLLGFRPFSPALLARAPPLSAHDHSYQAQRCDSCQFTGPFMHPNPIRQETGPGCIGPTVSANGPGASTMITDSDIDCLHMKCHGSTLSPRGRMLPLQPYAHTPTHPLVHLPHLTAWISCEASLTSESESPTLQRISSQPANGKWRIPMHVSFLAFFFCI